MLKNSIKISVNIIRISILLYLNGHNFMLRPYEIFRIPNFTNYSKSYSLKTLQHEKCVVVRRNIFKRIN